MYQQKIHSNEVTEKQYLFFIVLVFFYVYALLSIPLPRVPSSPHNQSPPKKSSPHLKFMKLTKEEL